MRRFPSLEYEYRGAPGLDDRRRVMDRWLARGVYFFLFIFVAAAPHSIAITQIAYGAALFLWVLRWALGGVSPVPQSLVWPLLVFLVLSAISATFSYAPAESWFQMKKVALLLVAVLWSQNLTSTRQVKLFSAVLIVSCLLNVAYTGWQYTHGIGARLTQIRPGPSLAEKGLQEGDFIEEVGGHQVRNRTQLLQALADSNIEPGVRLTVRRVRDAPLEKIRLELNRAALAELHKEIAAGSVSVTRGYPLRAQGFYDHYVTYADVLVQIALLAFGLCVAFPRGEMWTRVLLGLAFLGMAFALWLTLTRTAMASLLLGCLVAVFLAHGWRTRLATVGLVILAVVVGGLLLGRNRDLPWLDLESDGVQYRFLMWRDGVRLIRNHPFLGIGMESLKSHWQEWHIKAYEKFPLHSHFHSSPIQIAVERGLLTLAAWLWLQVGYLRVLARLLRITAERDRHLHGLALGMTSAACAFLLGSLTDYNWGDSEVVMVFWMFVGCALALERLLTPMKERAGIAAVG